MYCENISIENAIKKYDVIQSQIDDIILELIKTRKKKKITQTQLSKSTGVPQATISRLESFSTVPTLNLLLKLCSALNLKLVLNPNDE